MLLMLEFLQDNLISRICQISDTLCLCSILNSNDAKRILSNYFYNWHKEQELL